LPGYAGNKRVLLPYAETILKRRKMNATRQHKPVRKGHDCGLNLGDVGIVVAAWFRVM
jgi:hypothetical protein